MTLTTDPIHRDAPEAKRGRLPYKWELLVLLWFAYFFNRADRQIYSFVMPQIQSDLKLTDFQLGLVPTIFTWTYGLLVPFGGYLGDLLRRKWVIAISLLLWSAATLCTGLSTGFIMLIVLRGIATGGGEAFYYPSATSLIGQFHHRTRALALSIHQTALYVGVVASGLLVGWLAQTYGWRSSFYAFGIGGLVLAIIMLFRLKDSPVVHDESLDTKPARIPVGEVIRELASKPTVLFLLLAFACEVFVDIGFTTWMPTYLREQFKMSPARAGFVSMFWHHAFAFVGIVMAGRFTDNRAGSRRKVRLEAQMIAMFCAVPFIWMMGVGSTPAICIIGMSIFGFFRGVWESNLYATLFEIIAPRLRSSGVGVMICFSFLTGAFGPLVLGAVLKARLGLGPLLADLAFVYLLGGLMYVLPWILFFDGDCVEPAPTS